MFKDKKNKNIVIITAGGSGKRLSTHKKKQFIEIRGKNILEHTINIFLLLDFVDRILITLPVKDIEHYKSYYENISEKIDVIPGGRDRRESVYNALLKCQSDTEYVLIHDGVRPFVKTVDIANMFKIAKEKKAVIPVSKVKYTLKEIKDERIVRTIPRNDLYNAHTPQIFSYKLISKYHKKAAEVEYDFTDDASILEYFRETVFSYEIGEENFKITTACDLKMAKLIIESIK